MKRTATLIGATGLIGGHLLDILRTDVSFEKINLIVRRPLDIDYPNVTVKVIDFNNQDQFRKALENTEVVFCAIGTTRKKVNNDKNAYRKIDYDIPVHAATISKELGCSQFVIVSSVGADSSKKNFYLRFKGEVEDRLIELNFPSLLIFRPSLLLGKRSEKRLWENEGQSVMKAISFLLPQRYKPVQAAQVARAMVEAARKYPPGVNIYYYREMMNNQS